MSREKLSASDRLWVAAILRDAEVVRLSPEFIKRDLKKQGFPMRIINAVLSGVKTSKKAKWA